jgi:quercetin dioxygenase-like cupin family protein
MTWFHDTAQAARFSPDKLAKINLFESPRMFCDVYALEPGQAQKPHAHAGSDKVYHVLTGRVQVQVGDETRELTAGHTAIAPEGVVHGVINTSTARSTLLVVMAPHPAPPPG